MRQLAKMNPMAAPTGIHHVALTVTELQRSSAWYQRVLDLNEVEREESPARRAVLLAWHAIPCVGLVQHDADDSVFDPTMAGLDHVAFAVENREELDEWAARLSAEDVAHSEVIDIATGAILNFKDPDGIALALFWDR
jgi:catechol-2,3-dioxygenase